jgi:hypothetical protein
MFADARDAAAWRDALAGGESQHAWFGALAIL